MSQTAISSFQVVLSPYLPNLIECVVELCLRFPANIENIQARNPPSWLTDFESCLVKQRLTSYSIQQMNKQFSPTGFCI